MNSAFIASEIFTGKEVLTDHAILVSDNKVIDLLPQHSIPESFQKQFLDGYLVAPAFIDLQIYGGNGLLFSSDLSTASLKSTYAYCLQGGCSRFMITMATNSMEKIWQGIDVVRKYWEEGGKGLIGLHLEGPYINVAKKGAHVEAFIRKPEWEELNRLLQKGKGIVKMMTLAPECCSAEIIALLQNHGILVSAGHSNANYGEGINSFYAGIPAATHLFNAMSAFQGRSPGLVGAIYDHPEVRSSVVCDGVHVDFASIRISKKIMGDRLFLITDAVAETLEGEYIHVFKGDRYCLPDGTLSGSSLTMIGAVQNAVEKVGIPLHEALRMASAYPASLVGKQNHWGTISPGCEAHFVLINEQLEVIKVVADAEIFQN
jgi:N-acetylglucosamine-6-phosphate deacetylase